MAACCCNVGKAKLAVLVFSARENSKDVAEWLTKRSAMGLNGNLFPYTISTQTSQSISPRHFIFGELHMRRDFHRKEENIYSPFNGSAHPEDGCVTAFGSPPKRYVGGAKPDVFQN